MRFGRGTTMDGRVTRDNDLQKPGQSWGARGLKMGKSWNNEVMLRHGVGKRSVSAEGC